MAAAALEVVLDDLAEGPLTILNRHEPNSQPGPTTSANPNQHARTRET